MVVRGSKIGVGKARAEHEQNLVELDSVLAAPYLPKHVTIRPLPFSISGN